VTAQTQGRDGIEAVALEPLGSADAGIEQLAAYTAGLFQEVEIDPVAVPGQTGNHVGEDAFGTAHGKRGGYERYNNLFHGNDGMPRFVTT
jgi:hypothetical protein